MNKLENIIRSNYQDSEYLIEIIRKYDFEKFLNDTLDKFEISINESNSEELKQLATISLIKINENLKNINLNDKEKLEFLLSDIFQSFLTNINQPNIISEIQNTLLIACRNAGYNYEALENLLGLRKHDLLKIKGSTANKNQLPYYQWLGLDYELNDLINTLQKKGIIAKIKGFRKIFNPINSHFEYEAYHEKINDLVVIFDILKEKKLIKPKVLSGHFAPLEKYGMDIDGMYLFKKAPNRIHEFLKRDKDSYNRFRGRYEDLICKIASKTIGQRVVNGH